MTIETLKERIEKANVKIEKKQKAIAKYEKQIEKDIEQGASEWLISFHKDDIKRANDEIEETKKTIEKYEKQLAGLIEMDDIVREIPEQMKDLQTELVNTWDSCDIARRDKIRADYRTMDYQLWKKRYNNYEKTILRYKTDEEIHNANMQDAKAMIINLYNRVKEITGEVTDWTGIFLNGTALNGLVIGKEGRAEIESILAGGYNIQRLHVRVLVHAR